MEKNSYFQQCILCKLYFAGQELKRQFWAMMAHCSCSERWCFHSSLHLEVPSQTGSVPQRRCLPIHQLHRSEAEEWGGAVTLPVSWRVSPLCPTLCRSSRQCSCTGKWQECRAGLWSCLSLAPLPSGVSGHIVRPQLICSFLLWHHWCFFTCSHSCVKPGQVSLPKLDCDQSYSQ